MSQSICILLICFHQTISNLALICPKFSVCLEFFIYFTLKLLFLFYRIILQKYPIIFYSLFFNIISILHYFFLLFFLFFFSLVFLCFLIKQTQFNPNHTHSNLNRHNHSLSSSTKTPHPNHRKFKPRHH